MHCNRITRNKLGEIQDKASPRWSCDGWGTGGAGGVEAFSAVADRVVDAVHRLRVQDRTLVNTPGEQPKLFDFARADPIQLG